MDLELKGKVVLITGGSRGIGRACAEVMASEGCSLHLVARNQELLSNVRHAIESRYGVTVTTHAVDLSRGEYARALVAICPQVDILVNNAGAIPRGDLWQIDEAQWREAWDLKVYGYINLCRAMYEQMRSRAQGVIVNVIGAAGERPANYYIVGGTGNAALMAFTKALGAKSLKDGIRVVAVNPGLIKTERLEQLLKGVAQARVNDSGRWQEFIPKDPPPGDPSDVANLVAFLASDRAKNISGTVIAVDGGFSAS
jgi:NAD(P)-dependent dehydrogenase (short-subunit alcohol dehydrogenase family)